MARKSYIHTEKPDNGKAPEVNLRWSSVQKHDRYRSEWEDNCILLDISHHQADKHAYKEINLNSLTIAVHGGKSVYTDVMLITDFPNLCDVIKLSINAALFRFHRGKVVDAIGRQLTAVQKFFIWMSRNGIYTFSELTHTDFESFAVQLA